MITFKQKEYSLSPETIAGIKEGALNVIKWILPGSLTIAFLPFDYFTGGVRRVKDSLVVSALLGLIFSPFAFKSGYDRGKEEYLKKKEEDFKNELIRDYPELYGLNFLLEDPKIRKALRNIKGKKDDIPWMKLIVKTNKQDPNFIPVFATKKSDPIIGINPKGKFWCLSTNITKKIGLKSYLLGYYKNELKGEVTPENQNYIELMMEGINKAF